MAKGIFFLVTIFITLYFLCLMLCLHSEVAPSMSILGLHEYYSSLMYSLQSLYEAECWRLGWASADVKLVCHFMSESFWADSHELWLTGLLIITCPGFSDNGLVSMVSRDRLDQSYILWVFGVQPSRVTLCRNREETDVLSRVWMVPLKFSQ